MTSNIYSGLKPTTTIKDLVWTTNVEDLMNNVPVHPNDIFYIPSGHLHSLGSGVKVYEVSDDIGTTLRLHDFGRTDRELHFGKAIYHLDWNGNTDPSTIPTPFGHLNMVSMEVEGTGHIEYNKKSELVIIVLTGELDFYGEDNDFEVIKPAPDSVLSIPNNVHSVKCVGNGKILVIKGEDVF